MNNRETLAALLLAASLGACGGGGSVQQPTTADELVSTTVPGYPHAVNSVVSLEAQMGTASTRDVMDAVMVFALAH